MAAVEGLRSGYVKVGGLFHFARMCDKIRLYAEGKLPEDYHSLLGDGFDGRTVRYLRVDYDALKALVLEGASDEAALQWCFDHGRTLSDEDILIFNSFMSKRGYRCLLYTSDAADE